MASPDGCRAHYFRARRNDPYHHAARARSEGGGYGATGADARPENRVRHHAVAGAHGRNAEEFVYRVKDAHEKAGDSAHWGMYSLMFGGEAGIIAGKREFVERIRRNPLFRALRVDKLVIAALEATLIAYVCGDFDALPALRMIRASAEEIGARAQRAAQELRAVWNHLF